MAPSNRAVEETRHHAPQRRYDAGGPIDPSGAHRCNQAFSRGNFGVTFPLHCRGRRLRISRAPLSSPFLIGSYETTIACDFTQPRVISSLAALQLRSTPRWRRPVFAKAYELR